MASRRHERTYARKQAIQALYQAEVLGTVPSALLQDASNFIDGTKPPKYAQMLVGGIEEHLGDIDRLLGDCSENWTVERMPSMDRAILRLACCEILYVDEVPVAVAINEAVDLAKEYGGEDDSPRFVNGVLGRVAEHVEERASDGQAPEEPVSPEVPADEEGPAAAEEPADAEGEGTR